MGGGVAWRGDKKPSAWRGSSSSNSHSSSSSTSTSGSVGRGPPAALHTHIRAPLRLAQQGLAPYNTTTHTCTARHSESRPRVSTRRERRPHTHTTQRPDQHWCLVVAGGTGGAAPRGNLHSRACRSFCCCCTAAARVSQRDFHHRHLQAPEGEASAGPSEERRPRKVASCVRKGMEGSGWEWRVS